MKQFSLSFLALIALSLSLSAQGDVSRSRWKTQDIRIDGNDKEWGTLNFFDSASGLWYAISNDNQNLYMVFSVSDQMKMRKLIRSGWSIELASKEKKRKFNAMLSFPAVMMGKGFQPGSNEMENRAEGNLMIKNYEAQMPALTLKGFLSGQSELKLNDHKDIQIAIGANSEQNLIYEIAIPLIDLMPETLIQKDELITLNVNVNAMTRPGGAGNGNYGGGRSGGGGGRSGGGMSGGGGGRMGGGGMSGGGGGRMGGGGRSGGGGQGGYSSGDRSSQAEKASFKQKFVLVRN